MYSVHCIIGGRVDVVDILETKVHFGEAPSPPPLYYAPDCITAQNN